ncbi:MAG: UbiA family prenyltransferase [Phycisphaerales bacterium]|jgi:4-hydroxybenzoate polyprenyltransferase|nr:UbiA family prenyltransferase [Phycisphaerales bacterium]
MSRFRDWYTTLRAGNLPTVWSNIALGAGLSGAAAPAPASLATALGGLTCLYLAGMALNDAFDVRFDRANASERPVAAGRIAAGAAMTAGLVLLVAGWCLTALPSAASSMVMPASTLLAVCILMYQWTHRASAVLAAVLMALCRTLVPVIVAAMLVPTLPAILWIAAACVGAWTIGTTLLGRGERGGEPRWKVGPVWLGLAALGVPAAAIMAPLGDLAAAGGGLLIVCAAWIPAVVRRMRAGARGQAVCWAIAGFGVLDAGILLAAGLPAWSAIGMICAAAALGAQRLGGGT